MPERRIWIIDVGRLCDVLPKDPDEKIGDRLGSNSVDVLSWCANYCATGHLLCTSIASRDLHDWKSIVMRGHASQNENYDNSSVSQHKVQSLNSNWVLYKLVYTYFYLRLKHSSSYHFKGVFKCIPIFSLFFLTHIYTAYNSRSNNYTNLFNLASFTLHLTSDGERLQPETHRLLN